MYAIAAIAGGVGIASEKVPVIDRLLHRLSGVYRGPRSWSDPELSIGRALVVARDLRLNVATRFKAVKK